MSVRVWLFTLVSFLVVSVYGVKPAQGETAVPQLACDSDGTQSSGAVYRICMPAVWNNDLLIYAHGYVSPTEPVGIPEDQMTLPDGTPIASFVNLLGYAFATTSYSVNGLAVRPGIEDLVDLVDIFIAEKGTPTHIYLAGVSEGGIITALAIEGYPDIFDGGLAACGPYGDFNDQLNYWGDFRVLFDYFFPGLLPGTPTNIPPSLMDNWDNHYQTVIEPVITDPTNATLVDQLLAVAHAPYDAAVPTSKTATIENLLWYNVFATNDGIARLGGQPFDNQNRVYSGSADDAALNAGVQRFSADPAALVELETHYQTTGELTVPLVTLHTTGDPVVPYWHAPLYKGKTILADNIALHEHLKVERYGHCAFESDEVLEAFGTLVTMVTNPPPYQPPAQTYMPLITRSGTPIPPTQVDKGSAGTEELAIELMGKHEIHNWSYTINTVSLLTVTVAAPDIADITISIRDPLGNVIAEQNTALPGQVESVAGLSLETAGTYHIQIRTFGNKATYYSMIVLDESSYPFVFTGILSYVESQTVELEAESDHFWHFYGNAGDEVTMTVTPQDMGDVFLELYGPMTENISGFVDERGDGELETFTTVLPATGLYALRVGEFAFAHTQYEVVVTKN